MNRSDLSRAVSTRMGISLKDAEQAVAATLGCIVDALKGNDEVRLHQFGTFSVKNNPARVSRNPQTGEPVNVPASKSIKFKNTKGLV